MGTKCMKLPSRQKQAEITSDEQIASLAGGIYSVGNNMSLDVSKKETFVKAGFNSPDAQKQRRIVWTYKYQVNGCKDQRIRLGEFPAMSLDEANKARDEANQLVRDGGNPIENRKNELQAVALKKAGEEFSRDAREHIAFSPRAHYCKIANGCSLGYRTNESGGGSWNAKFFIDKQIYRQGVIGKADDGKLEANGTDVLSFNQAVDVAMFFYEKKKRELQELEAASKSDDVTFSISITLPKNILFELDREKGVTRATSIRNIIKEHVEGWIYLRECNIESDEDAE